jgi:hypothetical protein
MKIVTIACLAGLASAASAGNIVVAETTWGGSDLEGWTFTPNGFGTWFNPGSGGNPGGFAQYDDVASDQPPPFLFAPAQFLGNYTGYIGGRFEYDVKLGQPGDKPGEPIPNEYSRIRLVGSDGSEARALLDVTLSTEWQSISVNIVESDWEMVSGTWNGLIQDVSELYFGGDSLLGSGPEGAVDNFRLIVPAPGAAALLGLGGLAVARRRR